jgi:hypothetical protein
LRSMLNRHRASTALLVPSCLLTASYLSEARVGKTKSQNLRATSGIGLLVSSLLLYRRQNPPPDVRFDASPRTADA